MKKMIFAILLLLLVVLGIAGFRYWTKPYSLPEITDEVKWPDFRLDFTDERSSYLRLLAHSDVRAAPPSLPLKNDRDADEAYIYALQSNDLSFLQAAVAFNPSHLGYGTALRLEMVKAGRDQELMSFLESMDQTVPEIELQLALAYVDLLQNPALGTASMGKISFHSIEQVSRILERYPYDFMAHYARGINNLYWPVGLKRTDRAIQDLAFCVAVARKFKDHGETVLWPLAYTALGDALVKNGQVDEGYRVWKDGQKAYPDFAELRDRVQAGAGGAVDMVASARGMGQFQRPVPGVTDISIIWKSMGEGD